MIKIPTLTHRLQLRGQLLLGPLLLLAPERHRVGHQHLVVVRVGNVQVVNQHNVRVLENYDNEKSVLSDHHMYVHLK